MDPALDILRARRKEIAIRAKNRADDAAKYMQTAMAMEAAAERLRQTLAELDRDIAALESRS